MNDPMTDDHDAIYIDIRLIEVAEEVIESGWVILSFSGSDVRVLG